MLKDIILLAIGAMFGLGATMAGAAAPAYFPNIPPWVWHWLFWGGIALMGVMVVDSIWLSVQRPSLNSAFLINIGLLFVAAGIISAFHESRHREDLTPEASGESRRSLERKLIVNCESYVPRPMKSREDKKLYTTQIINPASQHPMLSAAKYIFTAWIRRCEMG